VPRCPGMNILPVMCFSSQKKTFTAGTTLSSIDYNLINHCYQLYSCTQVI